MRYYIFDTEEEAAAVIALIDDRARQLFVAQGYEIAADGSVVGKRASDGVDQPEMPGTKTFALLRQRLDGKWIVPHTENAPAATFVVDANGTTVEQYVGQGINAVIEDSDGSWFTPHGPKELS